MANSVAIKKNDKGVMINPYKSNPEFGYVVLESSSLSTVGGWVRETKRTTLMRGEVKNLEKLVASLKGGNLPGKIAVREFLEDEIPADIAARELREDVTFEEAIKPFLKQAGHEGIALTRGGKRIVRFTEWDPSGELVDSTISHDNVAEVAAYKAAQGATGEKAPF
jgi:hypothetical protein